MGKVVKRGGDAGEAQLAKRVCGTCHHWERFPDAAQVPGEDISGECLWMPPRVIDIDEDGVVTQASPVRCYRERCGQHQPRVN